MKDDQYFFHQTPEALCAALIPHVPFQEGDVVLEPFAGEGAFVRAFPPSVSVRASDIEDGVDFRSIPLDDVDWVVSNPPFKVTNSKGVLANAFFPIADHFAGKTRKGFCLLGNDHCFNAITPARYQKLIAKNVFLARIVSCNVRKWRGRYYFLVFLNRTPDNAHLADLFATLPSVF